MTSFKELATNRYSQRRFSPQPILDQKIQDILEIARKAPTAHNNQPQRIMVINEPEMLAKIDRATACRFGAPTVFLVCYDKNETWKRPFDGANSGEIDAGIVTTHLMFAAEELGLGSCWVMHFDPAILIDELNLSEHLVPVALLPVGYPAENARPAKIHFERKEVKELLI